VPCLPPAPPTDPGPRQQQSESCLGTRLGAGRVGLTRSRVEIDLTDRDYNCNLTNLHPLPPPHVAHTYTPARPHKQVSSHKTALRAVDEEVEEITKKYGLEAGLFSIFKSKAGDKQGKTLQAKDLLAKYGSAYLLTSISLSLVSFGLCYALISAGVDVASLLAKVRRWACMDGWRLEGAAG
jgi:hypothetical protein